MYDYQAISDHVDYPVSHLRATHKLTAYITLLVNKKIYLIKYNRCLLIEFFFIIGKPGHIVDCAVDVYAFGMCALEVCVVLRGNMVSSKLFIKRYVLEGAVSSIIPSAPKCSSRYFIFYRKCVSFE